MNKIKITRSLLNGCVKTKLLRVEGAPAYLTGHWLVMADYANARSVAVGWYDEDRGPYPQATVDCLIHSARRGNHAVTITRVLIEAAQVGKTKGYYRRLHVGEGHYTWIDEAYVPLLEACDEVRAEAKLSPIAGYIGGNLAVAVMPVRSEQIEGCATDRRPVA